MKFFRFAVLGLPLLLVSSLIWQTGANGNFEAWDDSRTLKVEVSHPNWKFIKNYVDNYQEQVLVIDSAYGNAVTFTVTTTGDPADFQWLYIYWGDGTGEFVQPGNSYTHIYNQKSRYNPFVSGQAKGDVLSIGWKLMDAWTEEPTEWPRPSFSPPTTGNAELDQLLSDKAIDNSAYVRKVDACYNDSEGNCLGTDDTNSSCVRACVF